MSIVILSRGNCGLSRCISLYMLAMASADLLVMIINVIVYHIFSYNFLFSFLYHTSVCKLILYLTAVTLDLSTWFTIFFTFDRFAVICCRKFKTLYCNERTAAVVITFFPLLTLFKNIPFFFAYNHEKIINKVHWGCQPSGAFFSSSIGVVFFWFHIAWGVWLPFTLIALFNCLTIRRISLANGARRKLKSNVTENKYDAEIDNRRKSVTLLFTVSSSFLLLWLTAVISFVTTRIVNVNSYRGDRTNPGYIATEIGTMLKFLSSCPNTFIYAAAQKNFRKELKKVLRCLTF
ncbi:probable G-protein coupled receptor 139 [Rhincodon typus]|uniref:probable G-protein coupled receptor 139 n=1 Tax=Rhincodon typus TaxID=259920 RepID=UPI00202DF1B0|nr:probable G-protein coupled receptor 139 [Rhincodon typus]